MMSKVLSSSQIEQFIEMGYVKVEEAYPRKFALTAQDRLWERLEREGIDRQDRSTWTEPLISIQEHYSSEEFHRCSTRRLADAVKDLIGVGRLKDWQVYGDDGSSTKWGWWPVNFSLGADQPWTVPHEGWHWDGQNFRHYVDAPNQGLLCLCLFSDIGPRGGGTLVVEGSHKPVASYLQQYPEGIELGPAIREFRGKHKYWVELCRPFEATEKVALERVERFMNTSYIDENGFHLKVVETTGQAGDVFLCHPFLFHAPSQNHSGVPRFMCNRVSPLEERMRLQRKNKADYSPLELSIRNSIF
ncbi:phytanoyl-CoA dioxygenase family protein [Paenibacillus roseipurpureus]|uniref:Phytanoyl-CoA dioxygenase family protein n=1 Tax=Paenibacillus roseopurpureus TaxID=2918901 RepID=A0AA96RHM1_9BACL|nr:phytanoyl-CoA dioxygenase family protein [Paenibacillus sp. MBLB1832]WNR43488.1 phytanoyl-CoA dioxygenase family protein [Paenibacillus sp. MBLB1832]